MHITITPLLCLIFKEIKDWLTHEKIHTKKNNFLFRKYGIVQFLFYEYIYIEKSKLCINTKHSLLIIYLHEHQAYNLLIFMI